MVGDSILIDRHANNIKQLLYNQAIPAHSPSYYN